MEKVSVQLKCLRESARPKVSIRVMAAALGMPASSYAFYEDAVKYKKPILPLEVAKKIADVLEKRGVARNKILALAGVTGDLALSGSGPTSLEWVEVRGAVAAGVWRSQTDWPAGERYEVNFGRSKFPNTERFGVRMDGLSMNRTIMPGSDLECLRVQFSPIPPQAGDLVIVERQAHDLVEMTCKRLAMDGDEYVLLAESTEPEFQEPIRLGKPDNGHFSDTEVKVIGIVLSAKLDLAPRGLSERRYLT